MNLVRRMGVIAMLAATVCALPGSAQVLPAAPQSSSANDGTDGPGFIRVPSSLHGGAGGYVDVTGYASCRYVTTTVGNDASKNGEVIPVGSLATWQGYLGSPIAGETAVVCCRPKTVSLCNFGGATPVTMTLPYTKYGDQQTPTQQCTDQWGVPYEDSQVWECGEQGSGVTADGQWQEQGTDDLQCSPNAFTTGCSASCPTTTGTTTTYDSCGRVQAVNACTISCCTPSFSKVGCDGNSAIMVDTRCGTGSYEAPGGCTCSPQQVEVGANTCSCSELAPPCQGDPKTDPWYGPGQPCPYNDCPLSTWNSWGTTGPIAVSCSCGYAGTCGTTWYENETVCN